MRAYNTAANNIFDVSPNPNPKPNPNPNHIRYM